MRVYLSFIFLAICLALTGCGDGIDAEAMPFSTALAILNSGGEATAVFNSSEPVTMELSITNLTNTPQTLRLSSPQTYEFIVSRDGEADTLWYWSSGKAFAAVIVDLELEGEETMTWQETWDQVDLSNTPVGPGDYVAQGFIWTWINGEASRQGISDETPLRSAPESFTIE